MPSTLLRCTFSVWLFCCVSLTQPEELTNVLEICNIVFTSMFTLEMILKLTAFGFFDYLRNPYNIFDGIIVIIRLVVFFVFFILYERPSESPFNRFGSYVFTVSYLTFMALN